MNQLELVKLNKHYGKKHALKDFSFTFTDGVYGLLGPNGAGKSTMMHLITDNLLPNQDGISFLLYRFVPALSNWSLFHYLNPVQLVRINDIIGTSICSGIRFR